MKVVHYWMRRGTSSAWHSCIRWPRDTGYRDFGPTPVATESPVTCLRCLAIQEFMEPGDFAEMVRSSE